MNDEIIELDEIISKKAYYFCTKELPVHCVFKDGHWFNGYILELGADFFILNDFKQGEKVIFNLELKAIEQYISPTKKEGEHD